MQVTGILWPTLLSLPSLQPALKPRRPRVVRGFGMDASFRRGDSWCVEGADRAVASQRPLLGGARAVDC